MSFEIDRRISFGNLLTAVAVVATVLMGWARMDANQTKLAEKIATIEAGIAAKAGLRDRQAEIFETRIRSVEIAQAGQSSDLRAIQVGIGEIKDALSKLKP